MTYKANLLTRLALFVRHKLDPTRPDYATMQKAHQCWEQKTVKRIPAPTPESIRDARARVMALFFGPDWTRKQASSVYSSSRPKREYHVEIRRKAAAT